jgi:hypothetical protein
MHDPNDLVPVAEREIGPARMAALKEGLFAAIDTERPVRSPGRERVGAAAPLARPPRRRRRARTAALILIPAAIIGGAVAYAVNGPRSADQVADEVTCYAAPRLDAAAAGFPSRADVTLAQACEDAWTSGSITAPVPGPAPTTWVACTGRSGGVDVFPGDDPGLCRDLGLPALPASYGEAVARYRAMEGDLFRTFADGTCLREGDAADAARDLLDAHGYGAWVIRREGFTEGAPCATGNPDPVNGVLTLIGRIRPELDQAVQESLDHNSCGPATGLVGRVQAAIDAAGFPGWRVVLGHELTAHWPCIAGFDAHPQSKTIELAGHASAG